MSYVYAIVLIFSFVLGLAVLLLADKSYRTRKWRRLDAERRAYRQFTGVDV